VQNFWSLIGYIRTTSRNLSISKTLELECLCCGYESGVLEIWKLPKLDPPSSLISDGTAKFSVGSVNRGMVTIRKPFFVSSKVHTSSISNLLIYNSIGATNDYDVSRFYPGMMNFLNMCLG